MADECEGVDPEHAQRCFVCWLKAIGVPDDIATALLSAGYNVGWRAAILRTAPPAVWALLQPQQPLGLEIHAMEQLTRAFAAAPPSPDVAAAMRHTGHLMADQLSVGYISVAKGRGRRELGSTRSEPEDRRPPSQRRPRPRRSSVAVEHRAAGRYRLRDGHRRIAAAKLANVGKVTALIHAEQLNEVGFLLESVEYNVRRAGYTDADRRRVARRLTELGVTRSAIADAFGVPVARVAQLLTDPPAEPAGLTRARREVARASTVIARKTLRDFIARCRADGHDRDVLNLLEQLLDGQPLPKQSRP